VKTYEDPTHRQNRLTHGTGKPGIDEPGTGERFVPHDSTKIGIDAPTRRGSRFTTPKKRLTALKSTCVPTRAEFPDFVASNCSRSIAPARRRPDDAQAMPSARVVVAPMKATRSLALSPRANSPRSARRQSSTKRRGSRSHASRCRRVPAAVCGSAHLPVTPGGCELRPALAAESVGVDHPRNPPMRNDLAASRCAGS